MPIYIASLGDGNISLTGPSVVRANNPARKSITFWNEGPDTAWVGTAGLPIGSGVPLKTGGSLTLSEGASATIGMNTSGTCAISWIEEVAG